MFVNAVPVLVAGRVCGQFAGKHWAPAVGRLRLVARSIECFWGVPRRHTFRADLATAGIEDEDARGQKVDFEALRTTFITNLPGAGVPQRHAMALARHTDPRLTAKVDTDQDALRLAEAVGGLSIYGISIEAEDVPSGSRDLVSECRQVSRAAPGLPKSHARDACKCCV